MPRYHFHLVTRSDRERIGCIDLPDKGAVIPAGLKLTTQILAGAASHKAQNEGWTVQATDDAGAVIYNFNVSRGGEERGPSGYVH